MRKLIYIIFALLVFAGGAFGQTSWGHGGSDKDADGNIIMDSGSYIGLHADYGKIGFYNNFLSFPGSMRLYWGTIGDSIGLRVSSGEVQFKNSGEAWTSIPLSTSGGGWTDNGTNIVPTTATDTLLVSRLNIVADTTALKLKTAVAGSFVLMEELASGDGIGGGLFMAIDSTYSEGIYAYDCATSGKQWVRHEWIENPGTANAVWAGAKDGDTDADHVAISAICSADGVNSVILPKRTDGVYYLNDTDNAYQITFDSKSSFRFIAEGCTLRLADDTQSDGNVRYMLYVLNSNNVTVEGGVWDANYAGQSGWTGGLAGGESSGQCIYITESGADSSESIKIKNLKGINQPGQVVSVNKSYNVLIDNVDCDYVGEGILLAACYDFTVQNCDVSRIQGQDGIETSGCNDGLVFNCTINGRAANNNEGIDIYRSNNVTISHCYADSAGICISGSYIDIFKNDFNYIETEYTNNLDTLHHVTISFNEINKKFWSEKPNLINYNSYDEQDNKYIKITNNKFYVSGANPYLDFNGTCRELIISDNDFYASSASGVPAYIRLDDDEEGGTSPKRMYITNNRFHDVLTNGIYFANSGIDSLTIMYNSFNPGITNEILNSVGATIDNGWRIMLNEGSSVDRNYFSKIISDDFEGTANITGNTTNGESPVLFCMKATVSYSNTSETNIIQLPNGARVWTIRVYVATAFNGSGTDLLDIGQTGYPHHYQDDLDVSGAGTWAECDTHLPSAFGGSAYVTYTYTDQNSDASAGSAQIYIEYSLF